MARNLLSLGYPNPTMEYKTMRRLSPTLKKMLEGLAYADLGEMLPQSAKDEVLTGRPAAERAVVPVSAPVSGAAVPASPKRVGLFLGPYATPAVVEYALESCARMNRPGQGSGNWCWRFRPDDLSADLRQELGGLTRLYGRSPAGA